MGICVLHEIAKELQSTPFYTIMADKTTDCSNTEQVVVCLCSVDVAFEVEEFVGLYSVDATDSHFVYCDQGCSNSVKHYPV